MKYSNIILIVSLLFLMASCTKESELAKELTEADKAALEGMEEAEHEAKEFNELLKECADSNNCTVLTIANYDSLFHYNSNQYDFHHANYSHNNIDDDHHHSAINEHSHGDAMHDEEGEGTEHDGHSIESHQEMMGIRVEHEPYHP